MLILLYALPGALTFIALRQAFQEDAATPLKDVDNWVVLLAASILWPAIALPVLKTTMLKRRLQHQAPS